MTIGALPDWTPFGTITFTWNSPATDAGAEPAYSTCAETPPIVTLTGLIGFASVDPVIPPVIPAGTVCPSPVANTCKMLPRAAGFEAVLMLLSWFRTAAWPAPVWFNVKMPGAEAATWSVEPVEVPPAYDTFSTVLERPPLRTAQSR